MFALRRQFRVAWVSAALTMITAAGMPSMAQEKAAEGAASTSKSAAAKKAYDRSRRVPPFFAQIGLTQEEKESIYQIQGKHLEKIEALEEQIFQIRAAMLAECEAKLTSDQRQRLEEKRGASIAARRARTQARAEKSATAKPAEPVKN